MFGELLRSSEPVDERSGLPWQQWVATFGYNGNSYSTPFGGWNALSALEAAGNSVVAAAVAVRTLVFSEATFKFQRFREGRPGELFGDRALTLLERPWAGASTRDLLAVMEMDASVHGNSYWVREGAELVRLPAARVLTVVGERRERPNGQRWAYELAGYLALPHDRMQPDVDAPVVIEDGARFFLPEEVAHYRPIPDPLNPFKGRSWIGTILPDSLADNELTRYKSAFIRNAATPNMAVVFPKEYQPEEIERFKQAMDARHSGVDRAFRTLYIGGGADVRTLGSNFQDLEMKSVQGGGETRIAVASGVPASILGISEGLAGSALNAGNYTAARRRFADGTLRPLWRAACAALQVLVATPAGARLWYDDRDIAFLEEDILDAAEIKMREASTMRQLIDGGFDPASVVDAVTSGDLTRLSHTGNVSVQLQPPGSGLE